MSASDSTTTAAIAAHCEAHRHAENAIKLLADVQIDELRFENGGWLELRDQSEACELIKRALAPYYEKKIAEAIRRIREFAQTLGKNGKDEE